MRRDLGSLSVTLDHINHVDFCGKTVADKGMVNINALRPEQVSSVVGMKQL